MGQDTLFYRQDWGEFVKHDLFIGYNGSPTENSQLRDNYHSIELGIWRSKVLNYNHPASASVYFSQELGLATGDFIHGTKFGGQVTAMMYILGAEVTHHTDYDSHSVTFSPFMGIGAYSFRAIFAWRLRFTNKDFLPLSALNVNVSFKVFGIKSKKVRGYPY
ncbi:hypothetical protein BFP71_15515 [Roseivirga misakiensis]|uniref:Outer membrane protein beta-barrel domain-containing protein n=2 Tax=Roseivirga misakiensis TaxID=1563681 RepID=A0A1E5T0G1_9BACT|nr:hypothetical protein BFP71_15515 [Roseivirga misakiensis]